MNDVAVLIPVLGRPENVRPLLDSLSASETALSVEPVFLCSPDDLVEHSAVAAEGIQPVVVGWPPGPGDYARKMNLGFKLTTAPWVFLGADDLCFHPGWATEAIRVAEQKDVCVVGTNDLGNDRTIKGAHSTHTLVGREYGRCGTADDPTRILHEGYDHNFVDDEFVQTAIWRDAFASAPRSIVEHLHPHWGKGALDATYEKGLRQFRGDREIYNQRRRLWDGDLR